MFDSMSPKLREIPNAVQAGVLNYQAVKLWDENLWVGWLNNLLHVSVRVRVFTSITA